MCASSRCRSSAPFGTQVLADLGADVIKIEDPAVGGDIARYVPPFQGQADSPYFQSFNRGKRSVALNLGHPDGQAVLHDLGRVSDALFNNTRGGLPAKLGLTYGALNGVLGYSASPIGRLRTQASSGEARRRIRRDRSGRHSLSVSRPGVS